MTQDYFTHGPIECKKIKILYKRLPQMQMDDTMATETRLLLRMITRRRIMAQTKRGADSITGIADSHVILRDSLSFQDVNNLVNNVRCFSKESIQQKTVVAQMVLELACPCAVPSRGKAGQRKKEKPEKVRDRPDDVDSVLEDLNIAFHSDGEPSMSAGSNGHQTPDKRAQDVTSTKGVIHETSAPIQSNCTNNVNDELTLSQLIDVLCRYDCNAFGYRDQEGSEVAVGVFPYASFFNHSCWPNIVKWYEGNVMCFRALRNISAGEELNISYISTDLCTEIRQLQLKKHYFFDCVCPRCAANSRELDEQFISRFMCTSGNCSGIMIPISVNEAPDGRRICYRQCNCCLKKDDALCMGES